MIRWVDSFSEVNLAQMAWEAKRIDALPLQPSGNVVGLNSCLGSQRAERHIFAGKLLNFRESEQSTMLTAASHAASVAPAAASAPGLVFGSENRRPTEPKGFG
ncbi:hypothetical protein [Phaeobacter inhibens]|uniref:hypothetical protein n=1 Tax=Phaeobacter inhibens TaxID=221822 RepID=UPI00295E3776|nr:hypothetical protein [Phaeobacter inhibens]